MLGKIYFDLSLLIFEHFKFKMIQSTGKYFGNENIQFTIEQQAQCQAKGEVTQFQIPIVSFYRLLLGRSRT